MQLWRRLALWVGQGSLCGPTRCAFPVVSAVVSWPKAPTVGRLGQEMPAEHMSCLSSPLLGLGRAVFVGSGLVMLRVGCVLLGVYQFGTGHGDG